ncbi:hypothetical protein, partial [Georgenia yuyongxinii]|uniref:hypothetical protein n=1 Tax=Georgenia yuyongxinii TaxID=2589797 RepID=UPI001C8F45A6
GTVARAVARARALAPRPAAGGPEGERGAASAELVGTLFVVVLVVGALLTSAAPGGALSGAFENTLCRAFSSFGLECGGAGNAAADSREPGEVCVVATEETTRSLGVSVAFVDVDTGGSVAVEELADGTFRVTYQGDVKGAVSAGVGGGLQVTVGDQQYGGELTAGASGGALIEGGMVWEVDAAEKDALVGYFQDELFNATTPIVGPARNLWNAMPWVDRYQPPTPTSIFGAVGATGSASASATALDKSASAEANLAMAVGVETNLETGEITTYYQVDADADAGAQADVDLPGGLVNTSGSADGRIQGVIAVTVDPSGDYLTNVEYQATMFGAAGASIDPVFGPSFSPDASGGQVINASVDLTAPESLSIAIDLLRGAGIPVPAGAHRGGASPNGPVSLLNAAQTFAQAAQDRGELWRQEIDGDSETPFALNASGKIGIGLGARYDNSTSETNVTDAQYWDGQAWAPWVSCHS